MEIKASPCGGFAIRVPTANGKDYHTITVPCSMNGMLAMRKILINHELRTSETIGHEYAPTQAMIDRWLMADNAAKAAAEEEKQVKAREELRSLGLDKVRITL